MESLSEPRPVMIVPPTPANGVSIRIEVSPAMLASPTRVLKLAPKTLTSSGYTLTKLSSAPGTSAAGRK
ncbi:hypothetical protein D3C87_1614810 [compost metagenome]